MQKRQAGLGFIFVTLFLDILGLGLIVPILPKFIETFTNNNIESASTVYGLLVAAYALMQFLFSPVLGSLSDQYGRRTVILISLLGAGIDYLVLAAAPNLWWLFVGRIISGVTSANITAATAYIADISPPEQRAKNYGLVGMAFGLGFILGPALGGLLGSYSLRLPFIVVAGITLLNALYGYFILPESLKPENRRPFSWARANPVGSLKVINSYPIVFALAIVIVLAALAQNILHAIWVLYTGYRYGWGPRDVGVSLAIVGLATALVQGGLIGPIVKKIGEQRAVLIGLSVNAIAFTLYGLAPYPWLFYVIPFFGAFGALAQPSAQAIITKNIKANEQGTIQGAIVSLTSLTSIIAPLIATNVFRYFISDAAPFLLPGASFFVAAFLLVLAVSYAIRTFARFSAFTDMAMSGGR